MTLKKNPLKYLKLQNNIKQGVIVGVALGVALCILRCLILYYLNNTFSISLDLPISIWLNIILLVGLSEEIVFRGCLLQKIEAISTFLAANLISTILFIIMHLPVWIIGQNLGIIEILQNTSSILWLSLLLGFVLKKSKSLWACMIIHSFNNFMSLAIS
ncbi:MAG: CPBP family intramembrane metalloprotease [Gammaproteobacteria bacterium]|nr:CPBP family intramembrane metalloprotease [Gammaproteobacteria bacterium]